MAPPTTPPASPRNSGPPNPGPAPPSASTAPGQWRKIVAQIISIVVILGAVVLVLWVWNVLQHHPRTDDATARANVVGIAPRVRGQIIKLNVQDNQAVQSGEVLFEIDPEDYALALAKAKAELATLDQQFKVGRAQDASPTKIPGRGQRQKQAFSG